MIEIQGLEGVQKRYPPKEDQQQKKEKSQMRRFLKWQLIDFPSLMLFVKVSKWHNQLSIVCINYQKKIKIYLAQLQKTGFMLYVYYIQIFYLFELLSFFWMSPELFGQI